MSSVGSVPASSVGSSVPTSSLGSGAGDSNADENITHTRGVIDDIVRNLNAVRGLITDETWAAAAGRLDDADALVESVRSDLTEGA